MYACMHIYACVCRYARAWCLKCDRHIYLFFATICWIEASCPVQHISTARMHARMHRYKWSGSLFYFISNQQTYMHAQVQTLWTVVSLVLVTVHTRTYIMSFATHQHSTHACMHRYKRSGLSFPLSLSQFIHAQKFASCISHFARNGCIYPSFSNIPYIFYTYTCIHTNSHTCTGSAKAAGWETHSTVSNGGGHEGCRAAVGRQEHLPRHLWQNFDEDQTTEDKTGKYCSVCVFARVCIDI